MEISTRKIQVEICFYFLSEKKTKKRTNDGNYHENARA